MTVTRKRVGIRIEEQGMLITSRTPANLPNVTSAILQALGA
jgi:hypothetical protein